MSKNIILLSAIILSAFGMQAQDSTAIKLDSLAKQVTDLKKELANNKKLKITGWAQVQFQYAETRGAANFEGGAFAPNSDKRFFVRRARVKFTYNGKNSQHVMQINGTERGMNLVDLFSSVTDPWTKSWSLVAGVMNRPFGYEIAQSSSERESPERSRYTQHLMPNERDLGAKILYLPGKNSKLNGLRFEAGFYNGQGIYVPGPTTPAGTFTAPVIPVLGLTDFDFEKDFIGHLSYYKTIKEKYTFGIGTSHYNGGIMCQNNRVFNAVVTNAAGDKVWQAADTSNTHYKNKAAQRIYYGAEFFVSRKFKTGHTTIRGEFITGQQPGTNATSMSPFYLNPATPDTYIRNFNGMYVYLIQRFKKHEFVLKYEVYDPNTNVSGKNIIAANAFGAADIKYEQIGITYNNYLSENVLVMLHYNIVRNEATGISAFKNDLKDNILTVRMQYKF